LLNVGLKVQLKGALYRISTHSHSTSVIFLPVGFDMEMLYFLSYVYL